MKLNKKLCGVHAPIGRWFRIFKGPWRCLLKKLDSETENVSNVISFCVVLHNMFQLNWVENSAEH